MDNRLDNKAHKHIDNNQNKQNKTNKVFDKQKPFTNNAYTTENTEFIDENNKFNKKYLKNTGNETNDVFHIDTEEEELEMNIEMEENISNNVLNK